MIAAVQPFRGVAFVVLGQPIPQGSMRGFRRGATGVAIVASNGPSLGPWRSAVTAAAVDAMNGAQAIDSPVEVKVTFTFVRPQSVKGRKYPAVKPDIDKLIRAVLDALTSVCFTDDARVVHIDAWKRYGLVPGAEITVSEVSE